MSAMSIRDDTDTALVRYFRRRRRLWLGWGWSVLLALLAFVIVPLLRTAL